MNRASDLLHAARFIRNYDAAAAAKGIKISLGTDFHEYISITRSTPTKGPTYPNFCPDRSRIESGDGFWMVGVDRANEVAALQAMRLYDLPNSNFAEHLETLKAFYASPAKHARPEDACVSIAESAKKMSGKVAYHGDVWVRKDYRGGEMTSIMAGIVFGVSFAMWAPDFVCALVARWLMDKGVVSRYGYAHYERGGSQLRLAKEGILDDDWLIWLTGAELRSRIVGEKKADLS
ncbi:hypothetical protein [Bradyrhizobium yuanmingense]|uniref:hypothetical protein n=1 Tax=Bradyrhizobium yuanmingense TaxID=108015 RepID=UPI0023B92877|nr:hypothetical protein [Bradyrhizobium yuanmingense]MDF0498423.1 hypothetical protein [Bradyrhizobium yuanmingense]